VVSLREIFVCHVETFVSDVVMMEPALLMHVSKMLTWNGQQLLPLELQPLTENVYVTLTGIEMILILKCLPVQLRQTEVAMQVNIWELQQELLRARHVIHLAELAMMKVQLDV
jgi:hypothetical protein